MLESQKEDIDSIRKIYIYYYFFIKVKNTWATKLYKKKKKDY